MMLRGAAVALAAAFAGDGAGAKPTDCQTSIDGQGLNLAYETDDAALGENRSYRERIFGKAGRITCPGYVTLRALTPDLTDAERALFCIEYDRERKTYTGLAVGPRDAYVGCKAPSKTFCERVSATRDQAAALAAVGARLVGRAATTPVVNGVSAVRDMSGALILTGPRRTISGTLGSLAGEALATMTAPAAATATLVTIVAVGGTVYYCSE